jgi:hypothetical protein
MLCSLMHGEERKTFIPARFCSTTFFWVEQMDLAAVSPRNQTAHLLLVVVNPLATYGYI